MKSIRIQNSIVIIAFLTVAVAVAIVIFRPDLVPFDSLKKGIEAIVNIVPGQNGKPDIVGGKPKIVASKSGDDQVVEKKDMYLIELKSGGKIYTDNLKTSDGTLSYATPQGLVISIKSHEVIGVRKYREGEEPDR